MNRFILMLISFPPYLATNRSSVMKAATAAQIFKFMILLNFPMESFQVHAFLFSKRNTGMSIQNKSYCISRSLAVWNLLEVLTIGPIFSFTMFRELNGK